MRMGVAIRNPWSTKILFLEIWHYTVGQITYIISISGVHLETLSVGGGGGGGGGQKCNVDDLGE